MEFPPILVINLAERKDRWDEIQNEFQDWPAIERLEAIKDSPGWKGCNKSHIAALELAKKRKYPWVLVLEDDCLPTDKAKSQFEELLPSLWEKRKGWDVFLGGITSVQDVKIFQYSPPLFKLKGHTTHFCLYNAYSYDKLINALKSSTIVIDELYRTTPTIHTICTVPHLAIQRPSKSDLQDKETDYSDIFQKSNEELFKHTERQLEGFLSYSKQVNSKILIADALVLASILSLWWLFTPAKRG